MNYNFTISTNNYSGYNANVIYYPSTGGTIDLGSVILPYLYITEYYYGVYEIYIPETEVTCILDYPLPTPTPTPTVTSTVTPTPTPTPTTIIIPPGAIPILVLVGYQTISPPENIVVSYSLEDICTALTNLFSDNVVSDSDIVDSTTYYFDVETLMLYNSVTNTFAEDGYYFTDAGILYVTNGLSEILTLEELLGICSNITPTPTPTPTETPVYLPPFISIWRTTGATESITLPYDFFGTFNGTIDWGDGNTSVNSYENRIHTYTSPGDYTVTIEGITNGISGAGLDANDRSKLIEILQWGNLNLGNNGGYFYGCENLILTGITDTLNLVGTTNLFSMFNL